MNERAPRQRWNTENVAIVGACCGLLVGSAHEVIEAFFHDPTEIESFHQIVSEIAAAAVGSAVLFALISVIRNRLKSDP